MPAPILPFDPSAPTSHPPGSPGKVAVMAARAALGLPLFVAGDNREPAAPPESPPPPTTDNTPRQGRQSRARDARPGDIAPAGRARIADAPGIEVRHDKKLARRYRVRVPDGQGGKRHVGYFATEAEARAAYARALAEARGGSGGVAPGPPRAA